MLNINPPRFILNIHKIITGNSQNSEENRSRSVTDFIRFVLNENFSFYSYTKISNRFPVRFFFWFNDIVGGKSKEKSFIYTTNRRRSKLYTLYIVEFLSLLLKVGELLVKMKTENAGKKCVPLWHKHEQCIKNVCGENLFLFTVVEKNLHLSSMPWFVRSLHVNKKKSHVWLTNGDGCVLCHFDPISRSFLFAYIII